MDRRVVIASLIGLVGAALLVVGVVGPRLTRDKAPAGDPAAFMSRIVSLIVADDYGKAWTSLNSAHKSVAPLREYVVCERRTRLNARLTSIGVVRVKDRRFRVPGASQAVTAKAVTLRIALRNAIGAPERFDHTFNVVADGRAWTWVLTPSRYALYRDNACGAA